MINVDDVMQRFCAVGANAVRRYVDISGEDPWTMPEYFMPAFTFDRIGDQITATLETNFAYLTPDSVKHSAEWSPRVDVFRPIESRRG
jgi:hypothetical protein